MHLVLPIWLAGEPGEEDWIRKKRQNYAIWRYDRGVCMHCRVGRNHFESKFKRMKLYEKNIGSMCGRVVQVVCG
jgi:hypothetical protein